MSEVLKSYHAMTDVEISVVAKEICRSSYSEGEIRRRLRKAIPDYPYHDSIAITSVARDSMFMAMGMMHGHKCVIYF